MVFFFWFNILFILKSGGGAKYQTQFDLSVPNGFQLELLKCSIEGDSGWLQTSEPGAPSFHRPGTYSVFRRSLAQSMHRSTADPVATSTPRSRLSSSRSAAANSACDANHNPKRNRVNGWRPNPPSTTTTQNMLCVGTLPGSRYQKARRLAEGEGRYVSFETTMHLQPAVRPRAARSRHQASFWGSSQSQSKERGPFLHSSPTSHLPMQSDTLFMKMGAGTRGAAPRCPTLSHAAPRRHVIELTRTRGRVNASTLDVEVKAMFSCFFGQ